jgi:amino acid transporter
MKKFFLISIFILAVFFLLTAPALAYKFTDITSLSQLTAKQTGLKTTETATIIATVINAFLGLAGAIFVILFIYGGFEWLTSAGNQEKIGKAKKVLVYAVIGLVIVAGGYTIAYFVGKALETTTGGTTGTSTAPATCSSTAKSGAAPGENVSGVCLTTTACANTPSARNIGTFDCAPEICCLIIQQQ